MGSPWEPLGPMLLSREMPILATIWFCSFGYMASPDLQIISQVTSRLLCCFALPLADGSVKDSVGAQCGPGSPAGTTEAEGALARLLPRVPDGQIDMPRTLGLLRMHPSLELCPSRGGHDHLLYLPDSKGF